MAAQQPGLDRLHRVRCHELTLMLALIGFLLFGFGRHELDRLWSYITGGLFAAKQTAFSALKAWLEEHVVWLLRLLSLLFFVCVNVVEFLWSELINDWDLPESASCIVKRIRIWTVSHPSSI